MDTLTNNLLPSLAPPEKNGASASGETHIVARPGTRKGLVIVEARRGGKVLDADSFLVENTPRQLRFARRCGVANDDVRAAIDKVLRPPEPDTAVASAVPFSVTLRGRNQPKPEGQVITQDAPLDALDAALDITDYAAAEPVIEWRGTDRLAALDVDYHDLPAEQRPAPARLQTLVRMLRPRPALSWTTHGQGLRLIYTDQEGFTADELAACAAVGVRSLDPAATVEILPHTRHPAYPRPGSPAAGPVTPGSPTAEIGLLGCWLGRELGPDAVEE